MSETITTVVEKFFEINEWKYSHDEEAGVFSSGIKTEENAYKFILLPDDSDETLTLHMTSDFFVPKAYRREVSEYLARVNLHGYLSCMKMDYNDGEIVVNVSGDYEDGVIAPEMVTRSVIICAKMLDPFLPGVRAITAEGKTALVAFEKIQPSEEE